MSQSDSEWDPTFRTPGGDEIPSEEWDGMSHYEPHRDPEVLREMAGSMSADEMAEELGVGVTTVREKLRNHGITPGVSRLSDPNPSTLGESSKSAGRWDVALGDGPYPCPECARVYETREEESSCIRSHAKRRAESIPDDVW